MLHQGYYIHKALIPMQFKSIIELTNYFSNELTCIEYLELVRWDGQPTICPYCQSDKISAFKTEKTYKCLTCQTKFNVKTNSIFQGTHIPLQKWFIALWYIVNSKKGISSYQLARDLGITQKTGWFMLHRLRMALKTEHRMLDGIIEVDETYIGGKNKNKHYNKRTKGTQGRNTTDKIAVFGILQRNGKVLTHVVKDVKGNTLKRLMKRHITKQSTIMSDEWMAYNHLDKHFKNHQRVEHAAYQYVNGNCYTNTLEGYWAFIKRSIMGIYHSLSRKHISRYLWEYDFRYNTIKLNNSERFALANSQAFGKRLRWKDLVVA